MTDPKQSAEELFGEALELPPEGRAAFVERMCGHVYELVTPPWFEFWKKPYPVRITGNQIPILADAPSRDSRGLFVLGQMDEGRFLVSSDGGAPQKLTPDGDIPIAPTWSPDGKYLVAMTENPATMSVFTRATKTWKRLRSFPGNWGFWSWATDSRSFTVQHRYCSS
jgi:hypothetical protein